MLFAVVVVCCVFLVHAVLFSVVCFVSRSVRCFDCRVSCFAHCHAVALAMVAGVDGFGVADVVVVIVVVVVGVVVVVAAAVIVRYVLYALLVFWFVFLLVGDVVFMLCWWLRVVCCACCVLLPMLCFCRVYVVSVVGSFSLCV